MSRSTQSQQQQQNLQQRPPNHSRLSLPLHHTDKMLSLIRRLSSTKQASTPPRAGEEQKRDENDKGKEGEEEEVRDPESEGGTFDEDADPRDPGTYYTFPKFRRPDDGNDAHQQQPQSETNNDHTNQKDLERSNEVEAITPEETSTSGTSTPRGNKVDSLANSHSVKKVTTPPFWPESPRRNLQRRESFVTKQQSPTPGRAPARRTSSHARYLQHTSGVEDRRVSCLVENVMQESSPGGGPTNQSVSEVVQHASPSGHALQSTPQGQLQASPGRRQRSSVPGFAQQSGGPKSASMKRRASEQPRRSSAQRWKENENGN